MFSVNVLVLLRMTRLFVPGMVARDAGHVINLGSLAGIETYEGGSVYRASKASVRIITKALRYELLGSKLRVTCINPGLAETEFSIVRLGDKAKADAVYAGMTPMTADDIAASIEWVATLPAHVNIEELDSQPVDQASAQRVHRRPR
jgi:NADP-dependent 3-hydroxy acid dehydrogenase YdfG